MSQRTGEVSFITVHIDEERLQLAVNINRNSRLQMFFTEVNRVAVYHGAIREGVLELERQTAVFAVLIDQPVLIGAGGVLGGQLVELVLA